MDRLDIDNEFCKIIPMLRKIALGIIYKKNKKHLEPDAVINEVYLYVIDNTDKFNNQDQLQRLIINWIKQNIGWENSQINLKNKMNTITNNYTPIEIIDDDIDIENKILIERWYNDKLCILELYRFFENSKIFQIIFDLYFVKGLTTGISLSKSLNISNSYGSSYIRQLHSRIKTFEQEYNNKHYS